MRSVAVALAGTLLIASTYGMARFGVGLFAPRLVAERPELAPVVGWAAAAQFVSYSVAAAVAARVSDRRPRAAVLVAGTTAALGCVGVATTASAGWFVVLVFLGGTGAGLASPALVRLVDAVTPARAAATAQSLVNTGTAVGVVVAGALALGVPSTAGAWWTMAALNAVAAGGVLLLVRRGGGAVEPTASASGTSYDWRPLATPAAAAAVVGAGSALVWSYGPLIATGPGPVDDGSVGFLWIALGIGGFLGPLTGRLVERSGLAGAWAWSVGAVAVASVALAGAVGLGRRVAGVRRHGVLRRRLHVPVGRADPVGAGGVARGGGSRDVRALRRSRRGAGGRCGRLRRVARRHRRRHRLPDRRPLLPRRSLAGQASLTSISTLPTAPSSTAAWASAVCSSG